MKEGTTTLFSYVLVYKKYNLVGGKKILLQPNEKIMKTYGHLFGFIELIKDTHHDEVFIKRTNHVIMRNNKWLYDYHGLRELAIELGYNPYQVSKVNYKFTIIEWEEFQNG